MLKISKKAQLYGLSIFIYSIAIAIILIIGLVGLTREIEVYSHAGLQRHQAMTLTKNAEMIRTLIDQERSYAVDRALFYTGAYGGYSTGDLLEDGDASCGVRVMNIEHVGEKEVPYWINANSDCVPTDRKVREVFTQYLSFFEMPKEDVADAVFGVTGTELPPYNFNVLTFGSGVVQTIWYPATISFIQFEFGDFNYRTNIHSQLQQETRFHELLEKSKEFARKDEYANYTFDEDILPRYLEKEGNYGAFGTLADNYRCCPNNNCNELSNTYSGECTIHAERNPITGKLDNIDFSGTCGVNDDSDKAIRCVLEKVIDKINEDKLDNVNHLEDDISHRYEIFNLNLTYDGSAGC